MGQLPQAAGRGFGSWSCALSPWDGPRCGHGPLGVTFQGVEVMGAPQRAPCGASPSAMGIWGPPHHGMALPAPSSDALPGGGCPLCPWAPREVPPSSCLAESFGQPPEPERGEKWPRAVFFHQPPTKTRQGGRLPLGAVPIEPPGPGSLCLLLLLSPHTSGSGPGTPALHGPACGSGLGAALSRGGFPLRKEPRLRVQPRKCAKAPRIGSGP